MLFRSWGVDAASVTPTTTENEPAAVGVPLIRPLEGFKINPDGSWPPARENVYGVVPPEGLHCKEKGVPTAIGPGAGQLIAGAGRMVPVYVWEAIVVPPIKVLSPAVTV